MGWRPSARVGRAAALVCGFLLRLYFVAHHPRFGGDTLIYGHLAHNLLAHHVFSFDESTLRPTLIRLPGYPAFLAGCFALFGDQNYLAVLWVQVAVDLAGCFLLASVARRLAGERAEFATLWLAALCPFTSNYAATALTETLSIFCVIATIATLQRWMAAGTTERHRLAWMAAFGAALAAAVMLRPDQGLVAAAFFPVAIIVAWRSQRGFREGLGQRLLPIALAGAILTMPMALWGARNWQVFHVVQPLAPRYANDPGEFVPLGFQRWYRTWAIDYKSTYDTYWNYDGAALSTANFPKRAFDSAPEQADTTALIRRYNVEQTATPALDVDFARLADDRTQAHPWRVHLLLPVARVANMWLRPRTEWMKSPLDWWNFRGHPAASAAALLYALWNAGYLGLAVYGGLRWRVKGWSGYRLLALGMLGFVALRCALLLNLDNSEPRYTLECFPVVFLLAGIAFLRHAEAKTSSPMNDGGAPILLECKFALVDRAIDHNV